MVRTFPPFLSERKKRTTSEGSLQFLNGFSGKLLFHLTFNRNFRYFLLNGKHPVCPQFDSRAKALPTKRSEKGYGDENG